MKEVAGHQLIMLTGAPSTDQVVVVHLTLEMAEDQVEEDRTLTAPILAVHLMGMVGDGETPAGLGVVMLMCAETV